MLIKAVKLLVVFVFGGLSYGAVEVVCRGYTFISMGIVGGACVVMLHLLNDERRNGMKLNTLLLISSFFIVSCELFAGEILNRSLKMNIWSYKSLPLNFDGQICLIYAFAWYALSFVGIVFDEWLRMKVFGEHNYPIFIRAQKKKA